MPVIKTEIFQKSFVNTPEEISTPIRALCRDLSPNNRPTWVAVKPDPNAIVSECFINAAARVARDGGSLVFGWTIWEWPRIFIEAEHHAVWEKDGERLDITPHVNGQQRILFLPDPGRVYDFEGKRRLINVKRSLGEFSSVDRWIAASDDLQRTMEDNSVGNEVRMNREHLKALWERARMAQAQVLIDLVSNTKVNAPCFCRSGKKFKKCCALLTDLNTHGLEIANVKRVEDYGG